MLKAEYQILDLPKPIRKDIELFCRLRGCEYEQIFNAKIEDGIVAMALVNGLIAFLMRKDHSLKWITRAANQEVDYVRRVMKEARKRDFPIRTTKYEAMA